MPERLSRHAVTAARRKQIIGLTFQQDLSARPLHELLQPAHRLIAQRNQALTVAFAHDAHHALVQVDLIVLEAHEFRDAQARCVEYFEHRAVAMAERIGHRRGFEQSVDFGLGQRLRQRAADFGHRDLGGRIDRDRGFADHETIESAETG